MNLDKIIKPVKNYKSKHKVTMDKYVDPALFWVASNGAYLVGADKTLDYISANVDSGEGPAMLGASAALASGMILANKYVFNPASKKIKAFHEKRMSEGKKVDLTSWARTAGQVGAMIGIGALLNFPGTTENFKSDAERVVNAFSRNNSKIERTIAEEEPAKYNPKDIKFIMTPNGCDIDPSSLKSVLPKGWDPNTIYSDIYSKEGRILRTSLWGDTITKAEKKYGLEEGILFAGIMQESMGNPLQLSDNDEGSAGLGMFLAKTAREYDLKVFGNSNSFGKDMNHGNELRKLMESQNCDYTKLAELDERFDVKKSIDANARKLKDLYEQTGSWDKALSAYNRGVPATNPRSTSHVKKTREWQLTYFNHIKESGGEVDSGLLAKLEEDNSQDSCRFIRETTAGGDLLYCGSNKSPKALAGEFNSWDKKSGDNYKLVDSSNIINRSRKPVKSGEIPYVLAKKN